MSANMFIKILKKFEPFHRLMKQKENEFYKTGTLKGVNTRAGYIKNNKDNLYRFAAMINAPDKSTKNIMKIILKNIE